MTSLRAIVRDLAAGVSRWVRNPRCPWCGERTTQLELHYQLEHAGDRP